MVKKDSFAKYVVVAVILFLVFIAALSAIFITQQTAFDGGVCVDSFATLEKVCEEGTDGSDVLESNGCRKLICGDRIIQACPKPDDSSYTYFEMYHKSGSYDTEVCLGDTCIGSSGYAKSAEITFCEPDPLPDEEGDVEVDSCASDVKECSDGSFVSRNPDNSCEFKACPVIDEVGDSITEGLDYFTIKWFGAGVLAVIFIVSMFLLIKRGKK